MHVISFDNMDDAYDAMDTMEDRANLNLTPGQVRLRDDVEHTRYWVRMIPEYDGLVIYGKVPPVAETQREAEFDVVDNRARGYLTGTAFSLWEPEGEPGDTHVSEVIPITPTEFVFAERLGWPDMDRLKGTEHGPILGMMLYRCEQAAQR